MFLAPIQRKVLKKSCLAYLCGILLLTTAGVAAAEPVQEHALDDFVVTATRISQPVKEVTAAVSVITREMIENSNATSVAELLPTIPGVAITNQYGGYGARTGIAIRGINGGADSQKLLLLIDGRPANGAFKGTINWSTIPLSNVERIEVVRGPVSVLYGNNAFGGAVNIITKKPEKDSTTISTSYGSWATQTWSLVQEGKTDKVGYTFTADYGKSNGFRDHSDYEGNTFSLKADVGDAVTIRTGYTKFDRTNPGTVGLAKADSRYNPWDQDKVEAFYADLLFKLNRGTMPSQIRIYYNQTDSDNITEQKQNNTYNGRWSLAQTLKDQTTGIQFQQSLVKSDQRNFIWGSDYQHLAADNTAYSNNGTATFSAYSADTTAAYIQNNQQLSRKLRMDLGARYDHHSVYGGQVNPKFGLAYQAQGDTTVKLNISRAFMAPSMNDLYYASGKNPNLKPERMWNYEIGFDKQVDSNSKASIVFYKQNIQDMIRKVGALKQNVDSANPQGIEVEWSSQLNPNLNYSVNYTYQDMGPLTKYASKHKGNLALHYKKDAWKASLMQQYIGTSWDGDRTGNTIPNTIAAYSITNMKVTYLSDRNYEVTFGVDNLFDKYHEQTSYQPLPGRFYMVSVKTRL